MFSGETMELNIDLRQTVRSRILEQMVRKVAVPPGGLKVLVVDRVSVRVLLDAIPASVLSEPRNGVSIIEFLDLAREPLPALHAIYFLTPTRASIAAFADEDPGQYASFHLFTSAPLDNTLLSTIREKKDLMKKIKTLNEFGLDFYAPESGLFHFGRGVGAVPRMYFPGSSTRAAEVEASARRIAQVCRMVAPRKWNIRYFAPSEGAKLVAAMTKLAMESRAAGAGDEKDGTTAEGDQVELATVLVVDRVADVMSPLLHEFTYQAMAHDVVAFDHTQPGRPVYKWKDSDKSLENPFGDDDDDSTWKAVKHLHIAEASTKVNEDFKEFVETNAAAKLRSRPNSPINGQPGGQTDPIDVKDLSAAVRALPHYEKTIKRLSMHVHILEQCFYVFKIRQLKAIAELEQNLSLGRDPAELRLKSETMINQIRERIQDPTIVPDEKARLLLIAHSVAKGTAAYTGRPSALSLASFASQFDALSLEGGPEFVDRLKGLDLLLNLPGALLADAASKGWMERRRERRAAKEAYSHRKTQAHGEDMPYELSRFSSPFRHVLADMVDGSLSTDMYPFAAAGSLDPDGTPAVCTDKGQVFVVFVTGGVCYSEIREAYDVASKHPNTAIIVGSEGVLRPDKYLLALEAMCNPALAVQMMQELDTVDEANLVRKAHIRQQRQAATGSSRRDTKSSDPVATLPENSQIVRRNRRGILHRKKGEMKDAKAPESPRSRRKAKKKDVA